MLGGDGLGWNHLGIHDKLEVVPSYKPIVNLGRTSATGVSGKMGVMFLKKTCWRRPERGLCAIENLAILFISGPVALSTVYLLIPISRTTDMPVELAANQEMLIYGY